MSQIIALTYNLKRTAHEAESVPFDFYSEFDSPATIEAISGALRAGGYEVHLVEADEDLPRWFLEHPVDLVFNIAEGTAGGHRESHVPAVLESLGIPFTGSGSTTLALALDKTRTKQVLAYEGIPTPAWQLLVSPEDPLNPRLQFPLIVKPNREGSAKGIMRENVVRDEEALCRQVRRLYEQYRQEVLVEEFVEGLELTIGVLGNDAPRALPILEIDFASCEQSGEFFYSWRMKEYEGNKELGLDPTHHCPARLDAAMTEAVQRVALHVHRALGCRDLSRTDVRLRRDGTPFVLEVNPLPGLSPQDSNFPIMTTAAGIAYPALITHLVELALARYRQGAQPHELSPTQPLFSAARAQEISAGRLAVSRSVP